LSKEGRFRPAWLWSLLNVVRQLHEYGEVRIGGLHFEPLPSTLPHNCEHCTDAVLNAIHSYNMTYDLKELSGLECICFDSYEKELSRLNDKVDEVELIQTLMNFSARHARSVPQS
jgi:uncharacterized Fe-S cluster-containing MiaB family protein